MSTPAEQLTHIAGRLQAAQQDPGTLGQLCDAARQATALHAALPPRYGEVLLNLIDRLESSALFSDESCSFSQKDLLDSLALWMEKARGQV